MLSSSSSSSSSHHFLFSILYNLTVPHYNNTPKPIQITEHAFAYHFCCIGCCISPPYFNTRSVEFSSTRDKYRTISKSFLFPLYQEEVNKAEVCIYNSYFIKWYLLPFFFLTLFSCLEKGSSADNQSTLATLNKSESKSIKKKSENIDLFAVDDRKSNIKDGINTMNSEASTIDIKSPGSYLGQISNRSYVIEQQAELLRLEAEKEQLLMDSIRIENEKVLFNFQFVSTHRSQNNCFFNLEIIDRHR